MLILLSFPIVFACIATCNIVSSPQQLPVVFPGSSNNLFLATAFTKLLEEPCANDYDCANRFANCQNNKCECRAGFEKLPEGICSPTNLTCPFGKPLLTSDGKPQKCQREFKQSGNTLKPAVPMPNAVDAQHASAASVAVARATPLMSESQWTDSCPADHFCVPYDQHYFSGPQEGHCCPIPTVSCPIGNALENATCDGVSGPYCPYETHYCYFANMPSQVTGHSICCPNGCPQNSVPVGDKCMQQVQLNQPCQDSRQCIAGASGTVVCDPSKKVCLCAKGYSAGDSMYCSKPYCPSPSEGMMDPVGGGNDTFMQCNQSSQCGSNNYCYGLFNICCRKPPAACPLRSSAGNGCKPLAPMPIEEAFRVNGSSLFAASQCPSGQYCFTYYSPIESNQADGICCSQALPQPPPFVTVGDKQGK